MSGGETEAEEVKLLLEVAPAERWFKKKRRREGLRGKGIGWGDGARGAVEGDTEIPRT